MATGLILDEFDLDLSTLATGLVVIVVLVLGAHAITLGDVVLGVGGAVAGSSGLVEVVVGGGRGILLTDGRDVGHDGGVERDKQKMGESESAQRGMMLEDDQIE